MEEYCRYEVRLDCKHSSEVSWLGTDTEGQSLEVYHPFDWGSHYESLSALRNYIGYVGEEWLHSGHDVTLNCFKVVEDLVEVIPVGRGCLEEIEALLE